MKAEFKSFARFPLIFLLLVQPATVIMANEDAELKDVELIDAMVSMEYFLHKLALSVDYQNKRLANFYAHELENVMEQAMEIDDYEGYPIGTLFENTVIPAYVQFESLLKGNDWEQTSGGVDALVTSCNACHTETSHGLIKTRRTSVNPFMQDFTPAEQ